MTAIGRILGLFILFAMTLVVANFAYAAGETRYSGGNYQFYNGSSWLNMVKTNTGSACSPAGAVRYSSSRIEFCDGSTWNSTDGGTNLGGCSVAGSTRYASSIMQFCNGSQWRPMYLSVVNGTCGSADSGSCTTAQPTSNRCSAGTYSDISDTGTLWRWNCNGSGGGTNASCDRDRCQNCGATTISNCTLPARNHGQSVAGTCAGLGSCNYTCSDGSWSQNSNSCTAPAVNGVCTNNAAYFACASGTANDGAVADTDTQIRWRCDGQNGGSNSGTCFTTRVGECPGDRYEWRNGNWGTCSGGTQTRWVNCRDDVTENFVADNYCCAAEEPASSQSCASPTCNAWADWQSNRGCTGGTLTVLFEEDTEVDGEILCRNACNTASSGSTSGCCYLHNYLDDGNPTLDCHWRAGGVMNTTGTNRNAASICSTSGTPTNQACDTRTVTLETGSGSTYLKTLSGTSHGSSRTVSIGGSHSGNATFTCSNGVWDAIVETGSCGSAAGGAATASQPTSNLCSSGAYFELSDNATHWRWLCDNVNTGTNAGACERLRSTAVNGACGPADGSSTLTGAPSGAQACSAGTYQALAGTTNGLGNTHNWRCNGSGGGTNDTCSGFEPTAPGTCPAPWGGAGVFEGICVTQGGYACEWCCCSGTAPAAATSHNCGPVHGSSSLLAPIWCP